MAFNLSIYVFQVKILYIRNLKADVTEELVKQTFEPFGPIERVKKFKDYCFVHFEEREHAVKAMEELNKKVNDLLKFRYV